MPRDRASWNDSIVTVETLEDFKQRKGVVSNSQYGRPSIFSLINGPEHQKTNGYLVKIGNTVIKKTMTSKQVEVILKSSTGSTELTEIYPTRFCVHCKRPSWNFVESYERGHATCTKCGTVNPMPQENISLHLNESGKANKNMWNHTPGMDHRGCLTYKNGKRITTPGQRTPSHLRNYYRIRQKIDCISDKWSAPFVETIAKRAKHKLRKFYYNIHDEHSTDDTHNKMPHGGAAVAAACFYASVLEYEQYVLRGPSVCTLPLVQETAQKTRDHKTGRKTRDVTDMTILKYTRLLKRNGLCDADIPQIGAKTLQYTPETSALEHARMAIFQHCTPTTFHLPKHLSWGIKIGNTHQGVLYVEAVNTDGEAFKAGIRKGDYIFQLEKENIAVDVTPGVFQDHVVDLKTKSEKCSVMQMTIMRKKKNSV
tara:strand:+ start:3546 stop:4820 length:1275 start_codon:yes stop_codon:yes gene_type:complete